MSLTVCKFGGSSLADGNNIKRVEAIVNADPARKFVVVSAPGKRYSGDIKVTDMLYACYHDLEINGECAATFATRAAALPAWRRAPLLYAALIIFGAFCIFIEARIF